jgi:hypothetical protein
VLFFYFVPDTTRDYYLLFIIIFHLNKLLTCQLQQAISELVTLSIIIIIKQSIKYTNDLSYFVKTFAGSQTTRPPHTPGGNSLTEAGVQFYYYVFVSFTLRFDAEILKG